MPDVSSLGLCVFLRNNFLNDKRWVDREWLHYFWKAFVYVCVHLDGNDLITSFHGLPGYWTMCAFGLKLDHCLPLHRAVWPNVLCL